MKTTRKNLRTESSREAQTTTRGGARAPRALRYPAARGRSRLSLFKSPTSHSSTLWLFATTLMDATPNKGASRVRFADEADPAHPHHRWSFVHSADPTPSLGSLLRSRDERRLQIASLRFTSKMKPRLYLLRENLDAFYREENGSATDEPEQQPNPQEPPPQVNRSGSKERLCISSVCAPDNLKMPMPAPFREVRAEIFQYLFWLRLRDQQTRLTTSTTIDMLVAADNPANVRPTA